MKHHWKILLWMLAGIIVGGIFQLVLEAPAHSGLTVVHEPTGGVRVSSASGPAARDKNNPKLGFDPGDVLTKVIINKGRKGERTERLQKPADLDAVLKASKPGDMLWFEATAIGERLVPVTLVMAADSPRAWWLYVPTMLADIFMALLRMLIVPLVLTSIISGVAGVGAMSDLRRMGLKTFLYYFATSMLAIFVGQLLVNLVEPGHGAELGLPVENLDIGNREADFWSIFVRMVPTNVFNALGSNSAMLQIIFFGLLFGVCITQAKDPHRGRVQGLFESLFEVMMRMAELVLKLIPYGVFFLLIKVVGTSGFGLFEPLLVYMVMIAGGLFFHAVITLSFILRTFAKVSPIAWARTMGPALMTAFSASSSSMTLPVTMECVEKRGGVSNKSSSFVLPLGATINMDGTALYECAGVIFLCQYYASAGQFELTFTTQVFVVMMALFASVGAAGIPSAGLILMLTILSALELPLEGAAILLAVDRPLDMLRTVVNVWSDSCGAAVIARSEGESIPAMYENEGAAFAP